MTWPPKQQPACTDTCCTGGLKRPFDEVGGVGSTSRGIQTYPDERHCGPDDPCGYCKPPTGPVTPQWIEDHDPDPAPGGGDRLPNRKATT